MTARNTLLDCLRGFAILLVVIGHSIQTVYSNNYDQHPLFRMIYSFHMPLFMFISGFVAYGTFNGSPHKLLKRFKTLVIPFITWATFFVLFNSAIYQQKPDFIVQFKNLFYSPDNGGLWFLWVLFLNYITLFLALKIHSKKEEILLVVFYILINIIIRRFTWCNFAGIGMLSWHLLFFTAGYILHKHEIRLKQVVRFAGISSVVLFPFLVSFWSRIGPPTFSEMPFAEKWKKILVPLYQFTMPFVGIFASYQLFQWLAPLKKAQQFFTWIGHFSLEIYASHFYFFHLIFLIKSFPNELNVLLISLIVLGGSLLTQFILKKNSILAFLFYGKTNP